MLARSLARFLSFSLAQSLAHAHRVRTEPNQLSHYVCTSEISENVCVCVHISVAAVTATATATTHTQTHILPSFTTPFLYRPKAVVDVATATKRISSEWCEWLGFAFFRTIKSCVLCVLGYSIRIIFCCFFCCCFGFRFGVTHEIRKKIILSICLIINDCVYLWAKALILFLPIHFFLLQTLQFLKNISLNERN